MTHIYQSGPFIGQLTGKQYQSFEEMLYEERKEAMRRQASTERDEPFKDIPLDKFKEIVNAVQMESELQGEDRSRAVADATVWLNQHPEYINNDRNRRLLLHQVGRQNPTFNELETGYQELLPTGLMELNENELAKQRGAAIQAAGRGVQKKYTEEELETMPIEDLKKLCRG